MTPEALRVSGRVGAAIAIALSLAGCGSSTAHRRPTLAETARALAQMRPPDCKVRNCDILMFRVSSLLSEPTFQLWPPTWA